MSSPSPRPDGPVSTAYIVHPERLARPPAAFPVDKRIGGLPLLERLLLTLERAGLRRFVLVGYPRPAALERKLARQERLAGRVEWRADAPAAPPARLLAQWAEECGGPFLVVSGNQVFAPAVAERLCREAGAAASPPLLLLASEGETAPGIVAGVRGPLPAGNEAAEEDWLGGLERAGRVERVEPPGDAYWQALTSPAAWAAAEEKINRSLYKPTDNFLARLNRRVSIPISRRLVPLGVGPNAVTLLTLALSIASGLAFAQGAYAWTVLGGFLAWFASMLDGSDGEVARLTYTESDFGCWLESTCDHLFYIVVFAGMAVGLYRHSGEPSYLYVGGLFEFGALFSFWVLTYQRKTTTRPGAASAYVVRWRRRLEAHRHNFFYRFALRYGELTRRSTLPYALFLFSLLGEMTIVLYLCTFGANLVWILGLYSNRILRAAPLGSSETD